ncbi:OLC1v1010733C1 [Oldenlandia corymbosa var. corymbosa]|uniref:OLC1v1010733C1 n=1 Tax=Oldenlandia corymbosa var. corymbosa TaxID=529605 RepID=A0AAV1DUR5_OLDCO|nr:OLC1v1010733C1 [Oldenlandia corymbosa var. corymbosa]
MASLYTALDPTSLILSQFSNSSDQPQMLQLSTQSLYMERGPRYNDYAALRESKLRMRSMKQPIHEEFQEEEMELVTTPPKKQVKFQGNLAVTPSRRTTKGSSSSSSILTQSVPDFSSALRKENRKPRVPPLPTMMEKSLTPPLKSRSGKFDGMVVGKLGGGSGSKSVNSGDKRAAGGLMAARKSYASIEDLRGLASDARSAIIAENRGGKIGRGIGSKTILGYSRQY